MLSNFFHYFGLIAGISTTLVLIAVVLLSIFAKPVLDAIMAVMLPILQAVGDGLGIALRATAKFLWDVFAVALPDFFSGPWQDRVALAIILACTFGVGHYEGRKTAPEVSPSLRAEYKLVHRTAKEKAIWKLHHPGEWF